jgi:hypothetical protein
VHKKILEGTKRFPNLKYLIDRLDMQSANIDSELKEHNKANESSIL